MPAESLEIVRRVYDAVARRGAGAVLALWFETREQALARARGAAP